MKIIGSCRLHQARRRETQTGPNWRVARAVRWAATMAASVTAAGEPRTAYRTPPSFSATVTSTGAIGITPDGEHWIQFGIGNLPAAHTKCLPVLIGAGGGDSFHVDSSFSIPLYISPQVGGDPATSCSTPPNCPAFSNFSARAATGWESPVSVVGNAGGRSWTVRATNAVFSLIRRVELVNSTWSGSTYITVSDAITVHPNVSWPPAKPQKWGVAAVQVRHSAQFDTAAEATSAEVPGTLYPFDCSTLDNSGEYQADGLSYGSFGNPTVYMRTQTTGVGLTPIDDIFLVHGVATQKAIKRYPRQPSSAAECAVTSPPSVQIEDLNLGIRTGEQYVQEWAIYPTTRSGDYYTFINALRQDRWGATTTKLNGTGYLSMNSNLPSVDYSELQDAGYTKPWGNWSAEEMENFLELQSMHFVTTNIPYVKLSGDPCRKGEDLYCTGSCFVNDLPPEYDAAMRQFARAVTAADKEAGHKLRPNLVYIDTWLSTETDAPTKYPDSKILPPSCRPDVACPQRAHERCSAAPNGVVYPLFYGTHANSYGKQLDLFVAKALSMGYSGLYHDDFPSAEIAACVTNGRRLRSLFYVLISLLTQTQVHV